MHPDTRTALEVFAKHTQWLKAGSAADQDRLLDFIITAHTNGDHEITQDEFLDAVNVFDEAREDDESTFADKKKAAVYKMYTYQKYEEGIRLLKRANSSQ